MRALARVAKAVEVVLIAVLNPDTLSQLLGWRPPDGVVTICLGIEHADRGQGWRTDLRDRLRELDKSAHGSSSHEHWKALERTTERIMQRFPEGGAQPHARCLILVAEVSDEPGFELYAELQVPPPRSIVVHQPAPVLGPLVELLDDGQATGVLAAAAEEAQLWNWYLGQVEHLGRWRFNEDIGPRAPGDTKQATGDRQTTPRAGSDQGGPHLEELRERFLRAVGEEVAKEAEARGWRELVAFGEKGEIRRLEDDLQSNATLVHGGSQNLAQADDHQVAVRVNELSDNLNHSRKVELCEQAKAAARSQGGTGSLGLQETLDALAEGRVAHLVFDRDRDYSDASVTEQFAYARSDGFGQLPVTEQMIEQALQTGAWVTQLAAQTRHALADHEGVAAILRF